MPHWLFILLTFLFIVIIAHAIKFLFSNTRNKGSNELTNKIKEIRICTKDDPYMIYEFDDFLTSDECTILMSEASKKLEPSRVYTDEADLSDTPYRDSMQAWMKQDSHPIVNKINQAVVKMTGLPLENQEDMQVVKYEKDGFFSPHYDACYGDKEFCKRMNSNGGPRLWTFMVYLNDGFEGGHTVFPNIKRSIQPKKGKLIVFQNTDVEEEEIIDNSLHGGDPVLHGNKWICNKWVRHRYYNK